jgi:hypothetical protein
VPPVDYRITQEIPNTTAKREFPDVGFSVTNLSDYLKAQALFRLDVIVNDQRPTTIEDSYYSGIKAWHMNPRLQAFGHFQVPKWANRPGERLEVRVSCTIIDVYQRKHELLPIGWVYTWNDDDWYFEP